MHITLPLVLALAQSSDAALRADGALVAGASHGYGLSAPSHAGRGYALVLSGSVRPGFATSSGMLGLTYDPLFELSLTYGPSQGLFGTLDGNGAAAFSLAVPMDPSLEGLRVCAAYAVIDASAPGLVVDVSNTIERRVRTSSPVQDFTAVDAVLESYSDSWFVNDGIAFVFVQNGEVVHASAFGDIGLDTRVPWASATKWFSGAALMRLVDSGVIELDDRLSDWLPSLTGFKSTITFRQAFSHTAGWGAQAPCLNDPNFTLQQCATAIAGLPLLSLPGANFRYGGNSMQVAGAAMELAAGQAFEAFVKNDLAAAIGAHGFGYDGFGTTPNPLIGGGAKGTVLDYARMLELILEWGAVDGRRVLSTESVFELVADQTGAAVFVDDPLPNSVGYGVGGWVEEQDGLGYTTQFSSPGAFGAYPIVNLEDGWGAFVLMQRNTSESLALMAKLHALLDVIAAQG